MAADVTFMVSVPMIVYILITKQKTMSQNTFLNDCYGLFEYLKRCLIIIHQQRMPTFVQILITGIAFAIVVYVNFAKRVDWLERGGFVMPLWRVRYDDMMPPG